MKGQFSDLPRFSTDCVATSNLNISNLHITQPYRMHPVKPSPMQIGHMEKDSQQQNRCRALLFRSPGETDFETLRRAFNVLAENHPVLSLRIDDHAKCLRYASEERLAQSAEGTLLTRVDLTNLNRAGQQAMIRNQIPVLSRQMNSSNASQSLQACFFEMGALHADRLMLVANAALLDEQSLFLLVNELGSIYRQFESDATPTIPNSCRSREPEQNGFARWTNWLHQQHDSESCTESLDHWLSIPGLTNPLPNEKWLTSFHDAPKSQREKFIVRFEVDTTNELLCETSAAYQTDAHDLIMTAVAQSVCRWAATDALLVKVLQNGRENSPASLNLSKAIGNFAVEYPVLLELANRSLGKDILAVREQLQRSQPWAESYGLLRHVDQDAKQILSDLPEPDVSISLETPWQSAQAKHLLLSSDLTPAESVRHAPLDIQCKMVRSRLEVRFVFDTDHYRKSTVRHIACQFQTSLETLVAHCKSRSNPSTGIVFSSINEFATVATSN